MASGDGVLSLAPAKTSVFARDVRRVLEHRKQASNQLATTNGRAERAMLEWDFVDFAAQNPSRPQLGPLLHVNISGISSFKDSTSSEAPPQLEWKRLLQHRCMVRLCISNTGAASITRASGMDVSESTSRVVLVRDALLVAYCQGEEIKCSIELENQFLIDIHKLYGPRNGPRGWKLMPPEELLIQTSIEFYQMKSFNEVFKVLDREKMTQLQISKVLDGGKLHHPEKDWGHLATDLRLSRNKACPRNWRRLSFYFAKGVRELNYGLDIHIEWRKASCHPFMNQVLPEPEEQSLAARISSILSSRATTGGEAEQKDAGGQDPTQENEPPPKRAICTWMIKPFKHEHLTLEDLSCIACDTTNRNLDALFEHLRTAHPNYLVYTPSSSSTESSSLTHVIILDVDKPLLVSRDKHQAPRRDAPTSTRHELQPSAEVHRKRKRDDYANDASPPPRSEKRRFSEAVTSRGTKERGLERGSMVNGDTVRVNGASSSHSRLVNGKRYHDEHPPKSKMFDSPKRLNNESRPRELKNGERRAPTSGPYRTLDDTRMKDRPMNGEEAAKRRRDQDGRMTNGAGQALESLFREPTSPKSRLDPKTGRKSTEAFRQPNRILPWTSPKSLTQRPALRLEQTMQTSPRAARVAAEAAIASTAHATAALVNGPPTPESKRHTLPVHRAAPLVVPVEEPLSYSPEEAAARWAAVLFTPEPRQKVPVPRAIAGSTLFRNITKRPVEEGELVSESDDDPDEDWLVRKHSAELATVPDIAPAQLEFLRLFDAHFMQEQLSSFKYVGDALLRFVRKHGDALAAKKELFVEFCTKAAEMYRIGDVGRRDVGLALEYLGQRRKEVEGGNVGKGESVKVNGVGKGL